MVFSGNDASKQQTAFVRKLYLAGLIHLEQHNLLSLHQTTAMPRRTLQDSIKALVDIGIDCHFVINGQRNNDGYYQVNDWGPINVDWLESNMAQLAQLLGIETQ